MIPVPLVDLKFLKELAETAAGISNRRHWCSAHFASGLPVSESSVPLPVLVFFAVSSVGVPSASLSDGAFGCGASAQTWSRNCRVFSWLALAFVTAWSGTPHVVLLSARNFTTFVSDSTKR